MCYVYIDNFGGRGRKPLFCLLHTMTYHVNLKDFFKIFTCFPFLMCRACVDNHCVSVCVCVCLYVCVCFVCADLRVLMLVMILFQGLFSVLLQILFRCFTADFFHVFCVRFCSSF